MVVGFSDNQPYLFIVINQINTIYKKSGRFITYFLHLVSVEEKYTSALKKIALLGGMTDYVAISSRELGDALDMSQQSASKRILELLDGKYIVRDLGARRQRIKLTENGVNWLKNEYNEYRRIFELTDHMTLKGRVTTGMGQGGYYISQPQ